MGMTFLQVKSDGSVEVSYHERKKAVALEEKLATPAYLPFVDTRAMTR